MKSNIEKNGRFRSKGAEILAQNAPASVESFLRDSAKSIKSAYPQNNNSSTVDQKTPARLGRLHIEIQPELVKQLMQRVYQRKCDPEFKGHATQRAVIEEALEDYFRRNPS